MSGKSKYLNASDGLPARVSGVWAQDKLKAVEGYTVIVNRAMERQWPKRSFIDLMSGCGLCIVPGSARRPTVEFSGSPLLAAKCDPGFTSLVFVESDPDLTEALKKRLRHDPRATVISGDCNDPTVIQRIRSTVPRDALSVAFVDNLGLDVTFETLRRLTIGRRIDLIVTFQISAMKRTVHLALRSPAEAQRWDAFFGTASWRTVVEDVEARRVQVRDVGLALADLYAKQLASIGYQFQQDLPRPMRNMRNAKLYTVRLFSKDKLGKKLFTAISPRERDLFDGA